METTIDSILEWFEDAARERQVVTPTQYVDAGLRLLSLLGEEQAKLAELEHVCNKVMAAHLEEGKTAAYAKAIMKALPEHREMVLQKAKCDRVVEFVRLAKKRASMLDSELRA